MDFVQRVINDTGCAIVQPMKCGVGQCRLCVGSVVGPVIVLSE